MILIACHVKKNYLFITSQICKGLLFLLREILQEGSGKTKGKNSPEYRDFINHCKRKNEKDVFNHLDNYDFDILVFSILSEK
jgi:bifunctional pyridoxal-dependent enzyme with beta-cystathionase and maltose regulon repressor activities